MGTKRVLVADNDSFMARSLAQELRTRGFECRVTNDCAQAKEIIEFWRPHFVFVDLLLPQTYALSILRFVNAKAEAARPKVFVMSKQSLPQEIEAMRRNGAAHYLIKPLGMKKVLNLLGEPIGEAVPARKVSMQSVQELYLLELFLKQATVPDAGASRLYNLMRMIGLRVGALRCSLTRFVDERTGEIMASNDDEAVSGLKINLAKYPELIHVLKTGRQLIIGNVRDVDFMGSAREHLEKARYETLAIFPVHVRGQFYGTLSLRLSQQSKEEMVYISKFGQVCAEIISLSLSAAADDATNALAKAV